MSTNTNSSKLTDLAQKTLPILKEAAKVVAINIADVLANPRPGETVKDKVIRVTKQTSINLMVNGLPKTQQQLPPAQSSPAESQN